MEERRGLPGMHPSRSDRIILHVDNDCFYAACERLREPQLRGEPVVVGMGFEPGDQHGAVATASYEAREYGVESAQPISEAMERLPPVRSEDPLEGPAAHYRPVDMEFYEEQAAAVKELLYDHAETVREVSIDEAYLDCSNRIDWDAAPEYAARLKEQIATEIGLPVSVGVGPNMSVAKVASDHDKPEGLVVVRPEEVESFLRPLPLGALHGVGPVTEGTLRGMGLERVDDLANTDLEPLVQELGERGRELHQRARGIDPREVTPRGDPKSLSRESAFDEPQTEPERVRERAVALAEAVATRATERGATYRTIGIKVVTPPYDVNTRERSLPGPVDDPSLVVEVASDLLAEFEGERVRKVGVRVSNLSFAAGDQTELGAWPEAEEGTDATRQSDPQHRRGQARLTEFEDGI